MKWIVKGSGHYLPFSWLIYRSGHYLSSEKFSFWKDCCRDKIMFFFFFFYSRFSFLLLLLLLFYVVNTSYKKEILLFFKCPFKFQRFYLFYYYSSGCFFPQKHSQSSRWNTFHVSNELNNVKLTLYIFIPAKESNFHYTSKLSNL